MEVYQNNIGTFNMRLYTACSRAQSTTIFALAIINKFEEFTPRGKHFHFEE